VLANIVELALKRIPQDSDAATISSGRYARQSLQALGFAKKFFQRRFRLFFRYDLASKIIVYAWVNDSRTLRTYGSASDAYAVFLVDAKARKSAG